MPLCVASLTQSVKPPPSFPQAVSAAVNTASSSTADAAAQLQHLTQELLHNRHVQQVYNALYHVIYGVHGAQAATAGRLEASKPETSSSPISQSQLPAAAAGSGSKDSSGGFASGCALASGAWQGDQQAGGQTLASTAGQTPTDKSAEKLTGGGSGRAAVKAAALAWEEVLAEQERAWQESWMEMTRAREYNQQQRKQHSKSREKQQQQQQQEVAQQGAGGGVAGQELQEKQQRQNGSIVPLQQGEQQKELLGNQQQQQQHAGGNQQQQPAYWEQTYQQQQQQGAQLQQLKQLGQQLQGERDQQQVLHQQLQDAKANLQQYQQQQLDQQQHQGSANEATAAKLLGVLQDWVVEVSSKLVPASLNPKGLTDADVSKLADAAVSSLASNLSQVGGRLLPPAESALMSTKSAVGAAYNNLAEGWGQVSSMLPDIGKVLPQLPGMGAGEGKGGGGQVGVKGPAALLEGAGVRQQTKDGGNAAGGSVAAAMVATQQKAAAIAGLAASLAQEEQAAAAMAGSDSKHSAAAAAAGPEGHGKEGQLLAGTSLVLQRFGGCLIVETRGTGWKPRLQSDAALALSEPAAVVSLYPPGRLLFLVDKAAAAVASSGKTSKGPDEGAVPDGAESGADGVALAESELKGSALQELGRRIRRKVGAAHRAESGETRYVLLEAERGQHFERLILHPDMLQDHRLRNHRRGLLDLLQDAVQQKQ